jgi:putative ABC transport system ATP-binding protein
MDPQQIVAIRDVRKSFQVAKQEVPVVRGISLYVNAGEFLVVFGPSGSGKSTLLHMMIGLERPTSGSVSFYDTNLYDDLSEDGRADFRKANLGMVYQQPNWIKALSVINNVAFPLLMIGEDRARAFEVAQQKLALFEMAAWADYYPTELSAGQQQRVSLARALVTDPTLIIADEPTGNLDFESGQHLVLTLAELAQQGHTVVMVTHDLEHLGLATRAVRLRDGTVSQEYQRDELRALSNEMSTRGMGVADPK